MIRMSLREGEMRAILMAKETETLTKAIEQDRPKAMAKENMEPIVNPRNRAQQEHGAG